MIVRTEKELERALKNKETEIIYEGKDAAKIARKLAEAQRKQSNASGWGIGLGLLCLLAAPFTGGTSLLGLGASAVAVTLSERVILAIIAGIIAISKEAINAIKEYNIAVETERLRLTRK